MSRYNRERERDVHEATPLQQPLIAKTSSSFKVGSKEEVRREKPPSLAKGTKSAANSFLQLSRLSPPKKKNLAIQKCSCQKARQVVHSGKPVSYFPNLNPQTCGNVSFSSIRSSKNQSVIFSPIFLITESLSHFIRIFLCIPSA